jgi:predicted ferric reductase
MTAPERGMLPVVRTRLVAWLSGVVFLAVASAAAAATQRRFIQGARRAPGAPQHGSARRPVIRATASPADAASQSVVPPAALAGVPAVPVPRDVVDQALEVAAAAPPAEADAAPPVETRAAPPGATAPRPPDPAIADAAALAADDVAFPAETIIPDHASRGAVRLIWLLLYVVVVLVPLALAALVVTGPPRTFILEFGSALGIAALSLLVLQLVLPARLPVLIGIGAEVAVRLHRRMADVMLAVVVAHVAAVMVADPRRLELLRFIGEPWRAQAAIGSVAALAVLFATSVVRRRIRLPYAGWRGLHLVAGGAALVLAVVHTVGVGRYLIQPPAGLALVVLSLLGIGALLVMRSPMLRRGSVRPYTVESVVEERGGAVTLVLRADGHHGQSFIPGQFAWLKEPGARKLLAEHPFSYTSSADEPARPSFTMLPKSGFTARAAGFLPGMRLFVDGPHGAFRPRAKARGIVLVAGGIGITPSISILRTAADRRDPRPHVLVYGTRTAADMAFLEDLVGLRDHLRLKVVPVLSAADADWPGERGRIDAAVLDRHLPRDLRDWDFMVCGSGVFVDAVVDALHVVGVPGEHVHAERFVEV